MEELIYKNGLLYTNLSLFHDGKEVIVEDVIIDTGAFHTIIAPIFLEELDTEVALDDEIVNAYGLGGGICSSLRKKLDKASIGEIDPEDRVNGLIGLDFLKAAKIMIDVDENKIFLKK